MSNFTIIPAIDLLNGQLVRLTQGDYDQVESYNVSPQEMAQRFEDFGVERLHLVDLDGAKDGQLVNAKILKDIRSIFSGKIEFGGGVRTVETVSQVLDLGIDFVILGSLLIKDFSLTCKIIKTFPNQIIAGIDAKAGMVATEGWVESSQTSAIALVDQLSSYPIESIIYTDIAKDGMMLGPNIGQLTEIASASKKPVIASGGVRHSGDISNLKEISNISACIVGKALLAGHVSLESLWVS